MGMFDGIVESMDKQSEYVRKLEAENANLKANLDRVTQSWHNDREVIYEHTGARERMTTSLVGDLHMKTEDALLFEVACQIVIKGQAALEQALEKDRQLEVAIAEHKHHPEDEGCVRCNNFRAAIQHSDSLARERNATKNRMIKELKQKIAELERLDA